MTVNKTVTAPTISNKLLEWYDQNSRVLPWRVSPADRQRGILPNPYFVWLSEIMLQQTTVVTVDAYFREFLKRWPTVHDLANADDKDILAAWAGLGYYARARNLIKAARVVSQDLGGKFPSDEAGLLALPGIGPYTAGAIQAIAFDKPALVLDGNIERVVSRLFAVTEPLPTSKPELQRLAKSITPANRAGDYVQAAMDLGATVCKPRTPLCDTCPLITLCKAKQLDIAADLPKKAPRKAKPSRQGIVYFGYNDTQVLLETRPDKGLLGGMLGLPTTDWTTPPPSADPPFDADWQQLPEPVTHVFTHFRLTLTVMVANSGLPNANRGSFVNYPDPNTLPTVMRKAYVMGLKTVQK